ncbi:TPA: CDP-archaeol synthase, partial [Candidatus Micrarchaeota archaeon]|nr:CDP-archaeol synthase [Candidatus Micrarchaeota archaeon]
YFFDGRRVLGNGVTYRGFFFGLLFGCITAALEEMHVQRGDDS